MGVGAAGDLVAVCANAVGVTVKTAAASARAALRFKALERIECMSSFSTKACRLAQRRLRERTLDHRQPVDGEETGVT